jgi:hypothetical protein
MEKTSWSSERMIIEPAYLRQCAFPRDAQFVHAFDAIFELATVLVIS